MKAAEIIEVERSKGVVRDPVFQKSDAPILCRLCREPIEVNFPLDEGKVLYVRCANVIKEKAKERPCGTRHSVGTGGKGKIFVGLGPK